MIVQQGGVEGEVGERSQTWKLIKNFCITNEKNENPIWAGPFYRVCYYTFCINPGQPILH